MVRRERSQSEILQDLLLVILEERQASKTKIMHRANLNQKTFQRYFTSLLNNGFVVIGESIGETYRTYLITSKGREALQRLRTVNTILPVKLPNHL